MLFSTKYLRIKLDKSHKCNCLTAFFHSCRYELMHTWDKANAIAPIHTSIMQRQDNKLSHLDVWILGALTHYRKVLKSAVESRRKKTQPVQINLWLRVVTLTSPQRKELDKMLKQISDFTWENLDFKVTVKACEFIDEGEGAALEVVKLYNHELFHLLDLGGGTITVTTYEWGGEELSTAAKTLEINCSWVYPSIITQEETLIKFSARGILSNTKIRVSIQNTI